MDIWLKEVEKHGKTDVEIVVIGNKHDLVEDQRMEPEVTDAEMTEFTKRTGIEIYLASAKSGENVEKTFLKLTETLIGKTKPNVYGSSDTNYSRPG